MKRYNLIHARGRYFMLSNTSVNILRAVVKHKELSYDDLVSLTDAPLNSLYVFAQRLDEAKLLKRKKVMTGKPRRIRTVIVQTASVKFCNVETVR